MLPLPLMRARWPSTAAALGALRWSCTSSTAAEQQVVVLVRRHQYARYSNRSGNQGPSNNVAAYAPPLATGHALVTNSACYESRSAATRRHCRLGSTCYADSIAITLEAFLLESSSRLRKARGHETV